MTAPEVKTGTCVHCGGEIAWRSDEEHYEFWYHVDRHFKGTRAAMSCGFTASPIKN